MTGVGLLALAALVAGPWSTPGASAVEIDPLSKDCIACHDGSSATGIGVDLRNNPESHHSQVNSFSNDHPIGMNYNNYVALDRGYKAMPLNTNMIFVTGAVGCLTCHDPMNLEKGHLVKSDQKSELCYSCHNK
jgi:predicted CXXCH cytochrome family protein